MIMKSIRNKASFGILLLCISFFAYAAMAQSPSSAPTIAETPCDPLYYESLSARAWLEAQREITQNQNLILKPDSVFEYTCFDGLLRELADHADEMLSETSAYGTPLDETSMDTALQALVGTSLIAYVSNNFGYYEGLLGGHAAGAAIKHTPESIVGTAGAPYSCDIMERVWQAAKCINFISNPETDGFYTFQDYATGEDKRALPTICPSISSTWNSNIETALTAGPWTSDPVQTYIDKLTAENCDGEPIPTGIMVSGVSPQPFEEHSCLQPSCRYNPPGGSSGGTTGCSRQ